MKIRTIKQRTQKFSLTWGWGRGKILVPRIVSTTACKGGSVLAIFLEPNISTKLLIEFGRSEKVTLCSGCIVRTKSGQCWSMWCSTWNENEGLKRFFHCNKFPGCFPPLELLQQIAWQPEKGNFSLIPFSPHCQRYEASKALSKNQCFATTEERAVSKEIDIRAVDKIIFLRARTPPDLDRTRACVNTQIAGNLDKKKVFLMA